MYLNKKLKSFKWIIDLTKLLQDYSLNAFAIATSFLGIFMKFALFTMEFNLALPSGFSENFYWFFITTGFRLKMKFTGLDYVWRIKSLNRWIEQYNKDFKCNANMIPIGKMVILKSLDKIG